MKNWLIAITVFCTSFGWAQGTVFSPGSSGGFTDQDWPPSFHPFRPPIFDQSPTNGTPLGSSFNFPFPSTGLTNYVIRTWENEPPLPVIFPQLVGNTYSEYFPPQSGGGFTWWNDYLDQHGLLDQATVPEPSTYALLGLGSLTFVAVSRRQTVRK